MEGKSCLVEIEAIRPSLSLKEARVADFILQSPREAIHPSIEELAERIGVSESTLFRFVRKLGYEGYQQFRIALATESVEPSARYYETQVGSGADTAVEVVFQAARTALELTLDRLDREALQRAASWIAGARQVLCLGIGGSGIVAQDALHKLVRAGVRSVAPQDFHLQLMTASQAGPEDVALLVSHTGVNKDTLAIAAELKSRGVRLIVITTYARTPLVKLADSLLLSAAASSPYANEAFSARIAQLAIVDAIYVEVMEVLGEIAVASLENMRSVIAKRRT
jgi:DNA-binding MurR/RpiR family transcriptional regulator